MPRNVVHQIRIKDAENSKLRHEENNNIGKVSWVSATLDCVNFLL